MLTDLKRLHQVLRNLCPMLSSSQQGKVTFTIANATAGWSSSHAVLNSARNVVHLAVTDTGIGISADKHRVILKPSSKPTEPQVEGSVGPVWACRLAGRSLPCWEVKFA
jgi:hypothetical protein